MQALDPEGRGAWLSGSGLQESSSPSLSCRGAARDGAFVTKEEPALGPTFPTCYGFPSGSRAGLLASRVWKRWEQRGRSSDLGVGS